MRGLKLQVLESDRPVRVRLPGKDLLVTDVDITALLELGRQKTGEPPPYTLLPPAAERPYLRLIFARAEESQNSSRQHILLQPLPSDKVAVTNRSQAPLIIRDAAAAIIAAG